MSEDKEPVVLVCAHASASMAAIGSTFDHCCAECGERVMMAPSGQALLKERPESKIVCLEREYVLPEPAYVEGKWTLAGATVKRAAAEGCTVLIGAGSICRIMPCTEEAAMRAIESSQRSELKLVSLPPEKALAAGADLLEDDADGPDDLYEDEDKPF